MLSYKVYYNLFFIFIYIMSLSYDVIAYILEFIPYIHVGKYGGISPYVNESIEKRGKEFKTEICDHITYLKSKRNPNRRRWGREGNPKIRDMYKCPERKRYYFIEPDIIIDRVLEGITIDETFLKDHRTTTYSMSFKLWLLQNMALF